MQINANSVPEEDMESDAEQIPKWCSNGNPHLRKNIAFDKQDMPKNALKTGCSKRSQ